MITVILIGGVISGLVILYLVSPHYLPFTISSARFFLERDESRSIKLSFNLRSLLLSRSFWMQLLVLILLLLAVLLSEAGLDLGARKKRVGVWIALDTSASMSTLEGNLTRMDLARREVERLGTHLNELDFPVCVSLSTFDLQERTQVLGTTPWEIHSRVKDIEHRALGTDVSFIRSLIARHSDQDDSPCPITHIFVITDSPFPGWVAEEAAANENIRVVWSDIASQVDNVGIVDARRTDTIFGAATTEVQAELAAYGRIPSQTTLTVVDENGSTVYQETFRWGQLSLHTAAFTLRGAGQYKLAVSEGGAYSYDDQLTIKTDDTQRIRVDWQLPDSYLLSSLGWIPDSRDPHIRVAGYPVDLQVNDVPTLLVGNGYGRRSSSDVSNEIVYFAESPLLDDINFDVAEELNIQGIRLPEDSPLQPVLYDKGGKTWFAVNEQVPAAYVPGLPVSDADKNLEAFSKTVFFNALRWLLQAYTPPPLYTLATPENLEIEDSRNALFPDEGYTQPPVSYGSIESIQPFRADTDKLPLWLALLLCATLAFLIERSLAMFGGTRWQ